MNDKDIVKELKGIKNILWWIALWLFILAFK